MQTEITSRAAAIKCFSIQKNRKWIVVGTFCQQLWSLRYRIMPLMAEQAATAKQALLQNCSITPSSSGALTSKSGEHVGKLSRVEMDILITLAIQPYCSKNGIKIMHQGHTVTHSSGKHPLVLKGKNRWNCHYKSVCLATSYRYNYFLSEFSLMDPKSTKSL